MSKLLNPTLKEPLSFEFDYSVTKWLLVFKRLCDERLYTVFHAIVLYLFRASWLVDPV